VREALWCAGRWWALLTGVSCLLPMMASPLLVVRTGCGMGLMPDPTVVAELELSVVDASSGGRPPHRWQTQKERKKELELEQE